MARPSVNRISSQPSDFVYFRKERWVESSRVTIGRLPDDVLLDIFGFYVHVYRHWADDPDDVWHTLVHVCRRWRNVVFTSPRRLRLKLLLTHNRSVKEMLDIWPELPIIILDYGWPTRPNTVEDEENVISALELNDRVSRIILYRPSPEMERFAVVMQDPFPALTHLEMWLGDGDELAPVISDSFLGGYAPRLQHLELSRIPFPALPILLLSATDLVILELWDIPHSGYISPEAMVACLSVLTRLEQLRIQFQSPLSRPANASRRPPPLTRIVLPALINLYFAGVTEYLEDLVARIDAPLLVKFWMTFFNQLVFNPLQLSMFLCRIEAFTELNHSRVLFGDRFTKVDFSSRTETSNQTSLSLRISCRELDWQLSSLSQVCNSVLLALSTTDMEYPDLDLDISFAYLSPIEDDMEDTQWLEFLHPFANVNDLHLSGKVATCIALALQEITGERVTEILPTLQNLFLDSYSYDEPEPNSKAISEFVAARQLSSCPVAIHRRSWDEKSRTWVVIESSTQ